eukprot:TRINITY_DN4440_c0_g1_i1.p1 TRINITY_DN4440_c0_g1~~TRINITY_DN4440_c0_g1_i1.p1  ORF type:complete len:150 (+),score=33.38 TRINITY_DN4440_c0_g1_i1:80-529(+)
MGLQVFKPDPIKTKGDIKYTISSNPQSRTNSERVVSQSKMDSNQLTRTRSLPKPQFSSQKPKFLLNKKESIEKKPEFKICDKKTQVQQKSELSLVTTNRVHVFNPNQKPVQVERMSSKKNLLELKNTLRKAKRTVSQTRFLWEKRIKPS